MTTQASFYIVPMFPYPSGRLHMGHVRNYAISDAIARHYRRQGHRVLHPIGWDAFGLPAENAARERGVDPRAWTDANIAAMRQQLQELGFEFTAGHEIATHREDYMALGQALFVAFYRAGLIERREGEVWWDPQDQTVLANEQVIDGKGWRSGCEVERRTLSMLFAKTRDIAHELDAGLEGVQWPHQAVRAQQAWIGVDGGQVRLRDWCLSRQRSWGTPVPLVECGECGEVPASIDMLPMRNLPTVPGASDLACVCPQCGKAAMRSRETLDTFWDSSFYTHVYPDACNDQATAVAGPGFQQFGQVDLYVGGLEHATMHLLYARWFSWAMQQVEMNVPREPFQRLIGQGMVRAPAYQDERGGWVAPDEIDIEAGVSRADGAAVRCVGSVKMSKSKKNGVDPSVQVAQFGAEAVRFAMLFAAPYAVEVDWEGKVVATAARHIDRMKQQAFGVWQAVDGMRQGALEAQAADLRQQAMDAFEGMDGGNALMGAALGVWRDAVKAAREGQGSSARVAMRAVADAFWPIIPRAMEAVMHAGEPTWTAQPITRQARQVPKPMVFQVNGVRRAQIDAPVEDAQGAIDWVKTHRPQVAQAFLQDPIVRTVWVPGKVVNVVTAT